MKPLLFTLIAICVLPAAANAVCCPVDSCYHESDSTWIDTCCVLIGDANNSGDVNALDVTYLTNYFRGSGPAPIPEVLCTNPSHPPPYYMSADVNGSCYANGVDITYLVNFLAHNGPAPVCCLTYSNCVAYYP